MVLDYVALGILIFAAITLFYGIIVIHDIPYEIAVHRNHPHQDAIHYAGWVSLFTLHAIWPFLWIWSTLYREDRGWGFQQEGPPDEDGGAAGAAADAETPTEMESSTQTEVVTAEASEPAEAPTSEVALLRHKIEALDDRIARIEEAILAASDDNGSAGA